MPKSPTAWIERKRDGGEHTPGEIHDLVDAFLDGEMADYQMSAWLMAAYLRGLSDAEMLALTRAMLESGERLSLSTISNPTIDKHSTGGVGDKLSLPLAPLVAEAGVSVPMIAGRGLGHTGGTLDKLEAISGYRTDLTDRRFERVVRDVGCSIIGATRDVAPADRRIYALRDVTGTVASRPLIVASILSKKLAARLDGLVLDVKVGRGAFMKELESARALARSLVDVATKMGTKTIALVTRMDAPLGRTIGNALEIRETIEILRGEGPSDTTEQTLVLGEEMLLLARVVTTRKAARSALERALGSGAALERFGRMVAAHGGDRRMIDEPGRLPRVKKRYAVLASKKGVVTDVDALALAHVALALGAGRLRSEDPVDPAVGLEIAAPIGTRVEPGEPLAWIHARRKPESHEETVRAAFRIGRRSPTPLDGMPLDWVVERVTR